jgi:hypothetical protein
MIFRSQHTDNHLRTCLCNYHGFKIMQAIVCGNDLLRQMNECDRNLEWGPGSLMPFLALNLVPKNLYKDIILNHPVERLIQAINKMFYVKL